MEKENTTPKVATPKQPKVEKQKDIASTDNAKTPNQKENVATHDTSSYWVVTLVIAMLGLFIGYRKK